MSWIEEWVAESGGRGDWEELFSGYGGGTMSDAGLPMSPRLALKLPTVAACVRATAETFASLSRSLKEKLPDGGRGDVGSSDLLGHLAELIEYPNELLPAMNFWERVAGHPAGYKGFYAEIQYDGAGREIGLWPLLPNKTELIVRNKKAVYKTSVPEETAGGGVRWEDVALPANRVLHIPGFGLDGYDGTSRLAQFRDVWGLNGALHKYVSKFFANGANLGTVIQAKKFADKKGFEQELQVKHAGLDNAHRFILIEGEGSEVKSVGVDPEKAQLIASKASSNLDICGLMRVPPSKVFVPYQSETYKNLEQENLDFVLGNQIPLAVRIRDGFALHLFRKYRQRTDRRIFLHVAVNSLLRGDATARAAFYVAMIQNELMLINEIRALEDLPPLPDGDRFADSKSVSDDSVQEILDPARGVSVNVEPTEEREPAPDLKRAFTPMLRRAALKWTTRESKATLKAIDRALGSSDFLAELDRLLRASVHNEAFREALEAELVPVLLTYTSVLRSSRDEGPGEEELRAFVVEHSVTVGSRHILESTQRLHSAVERLGVDDAEALRSGLRQEVEGWSETRPAEIADREAARAQAAIEVELNFGR